jgi:hypothetical protein
MKSLEKDVEEGEEDLPDPSDLWKPNDYIPPWKKDEENE